MTFGISKSLFDVIIIPKAVHNEILYIIPNIEVLGMLSMLFLAYKRQVKEREKKKVYCAISFCLTSKNENITAVIPIIIIIW